MLIAALVLGASASALVAGLSGLAVVAGAVALTGAATRGVVWLAKRGRQRRGPIGLHFAAAMAGAGLAGAAAACLVVALLGASSADVVPLASVLLAAVAFVAWAAYVVGMMVGDDIDTVANGLMAVGHGDRAVRLEIGGGDQVAHLADAGNRMIDQLRLREAERDEAQATRHALVRAMVDQLRERAAERDRDDEQRRQLFVGVSHDLRTPLTGLQLLANAIRDELVAPEQRADYAEQMLAQIASLTRLTEQVFELARLEAGEATWRRIRVAMDGVIRETAEQMRPAAEARSIALVVDVPAPLPPVDIAPDRIVRVLVNLVQNALEHTPAGGEVRISARASNAEVAVEVADTGQGIPSEDRAHVFAPFYRGGEGASRGGTGTGLGLAISRAIVAAHGGRMYLGDAASGSVVGFSLPR